MKQSWKEKILPYLFIAPAMISIAVFVLYPISYLIYLSLYDYNLLNSTKSIFLGVENYKQLIIREDFQKTILNTLIYTFGVVFATTIIALLIALWLRRESKFNMFIQAGIFTPHIISIVSISLVWLLIMEPSNGLLNFILKNIGLPSSKWLQSSKTSLFSIIIVSVWSNIGYYALILVAALQGISSTIYEAARLDYANRWTKLTRITMPLISPQLFFITIVMTIGSIKVFDTIRIMTNGGPNNSTTTIVYYLYSFRTTNIGYASAVGVILLVLTAILTFVYFKILSKKVHYQ